MIPPTETLTLPHPSPVRGLAPGTIIDGKYRLVAPIGAGGMGEVWLAVYTSPLGRSCAVKFLADPAPSARDRFLAEAQIMGALRHPNIVSVFDNGIDDATGLAYYVMDEFLPTPDDTIRLCRDILHCPPPAPRPEPAPLSLARLLDGGKTLPEDTILSIARQLLSAIEAAHALNPPVIHRDIKPSNILFAPDGRTLLSDFGIAKRLSATSDTSPTLPGATPGTPAYAAPEQLAGRPLTPAADFYSFGVVLYRALTGGMPGPTAALPSDIAPAVSRAWQKLFTGLLAPDPAVRLVRPAAIRALFDEIARDLRRRTRRLLRLALYAALALAAALLAVLFFLPHPRPTPAPSALSPAPSALPPAPDGRPSADPPTAPAPAAQDWLNRYLDSTTAAKTWTARYLAALQSLLARTIAPAPDADNLIRVGPDQILLSGDVSPLSPPPAILLDGGTLLVSPGRDALLSLCNDCAYYLQHAPDTAPLPDFLPAISRDPVSAPIRIGPDGGELGALDTALGIAFPDSLPRSSPPITAQDSVSSDNAEWIDEGAALDLWPADALARPIHEPPRDLSEFDLLVKSPILPADGLESATLHIFPDTPSITFSGLDKRIRLHQQSSLSSF